MTNLYKLQFVTFEYAGITHPYTGGIGKWIADLAPALAEYGHDVTVLTSDPYVSEAVQTPHGVSVHRVVIPPGGSGAARDLARGLAWQRFVRKWLLGQPPADLVIAPEWGGAAAAYGRPAAPRPGRFLLRNCTARASSCGHTPRVGDNGGHVALCQVG